MEKSKIAITFDDGPTEFTTRVLNALEKHGVPATFFVIGSKIEGNEEILKRSHTMGNEILPHAWNHPDLRTLSPDEIKKELTDTAEQIRSVLGDLPMNMYRPPYGYFDDKVKTASAEIGMSLINWSIDTLDWENKNADIIYDRTMERLHDGAIILCHDAYDSTGKAVERLLPVLMEKYELVTVSELLSGFNLQPGKVYDNCSEETRLDWGTWG
ncbi:MAG: polysaccharide deacetylase family protein [Defluviitaleaceae bacterium]|nr:polysaccharide deacetylase family protein [Defluviitaleaceae bacterium]